MPRSRPDTRETVSTMDTTNINLHMLVWLQCYCYYYCEYYAKESTVLRTALNKNGYVIRMVV